MASKLKNQLHTYPPGASETGCAYPYCPDPIANNIVLDDLNAVIAQTNLSNEIQQLLAVGLPAQSVLAPEYYHMVCDQEYVDPTQLSGIVADFCLCYEDPELAASQHIDCELLSDVYWYHPDYLGSNELITDITGEPYQYFFYTPFGETILQEDAFNASYDNPWRFNGKELDPETGNYYYGARYYNPKWSVWLSSDPLSHLSPDQTPYHFVSNNPVMRIDPNGLTDFKNSETGEVVTVKDGMNQTVTVGGDQWSTAVNFSNSENGNDPSQGYNEFISGNGGIAVPTAQDGGMIPDKEMFLGFMEFKFKNEEKEVAAFKAKDGSGYHFGPWKGNNTDSFNATALLEDYASSIGYGKDDISEIQHTHPNGLANPSLSDSYLSYQLGGMPVFSMGESPFNKNLIEIHKATPRYFTPLERKYLKYRPFPMNLNLYGKKVDY